MRWDGLYRVTPGPNVEPHQRRPPLGRQQRLQSFGIGVNENEPDDVTGVGAGVKPDEEATQRVAGEDVGSWDASGKEQCVKVLQTSQPPGPSKPASMQC